MNKEQELVKLFRTMQKDAAYNHCLADEYLQDLLLLIK